MQAHTQTHATPTCPQTPGQASELKVKTHVKAGGVIIEH